MNFIREGEYSSPPAPGACYEIWSGKGGGRGADFIREGEYSSPPAPGACYPIGPDMVRGK